MPITRRGAVASALLLGAGVARAQDADTVFRVGCNTPADHPLSRRLAEVGAAMKDRTGGRLSLEVFPDSQLGTDPEMLDQVRAGAIQVYAASNLGLSSFVPLTNLASVGYAFLTYDQVWAAVDGNLGGAIRDAIVKAGLEPLGRPWDNGFRQVTNNVRPIMEPGDLRGVRLRVPVTAILASCFEALGASTRAMPLKEVYPALVANTVDGQENPLNLIETSRFYQVQRYCSMTRHCWSGYWMVGNRHAVSALPVELRTALYQALDRAALDERAELAQREARMQDTLGRDGMMLNAPDHQPFQAALREAGYYRRWQQSFGTANWQKLTRYAPGLA